MTIKDIARESGYSVGTVSRVLNHAPGVSEAAKVRVMEVVEKYHFRLNNNAKHLKQQSQDGIAIIIKGTQNMLFASIVEQLQGLVKSRHYDCLIYYIEEYEDEVEQAIQICMERHPLGILFLGSNKENFIRRFQDVEIPCVLVTNSAQEFGFENLSSVTTDDVAGAKFVIEHLIGLGHKNIGILGGNMESSQAGKARYAGCMQAFEEHGMTFDMSRQFEATYFSVADGYRGMERLLSRMPEMTAVFAMSDVMAVGAIRAIQDHGLRVPDDISVVGYDGIEIGRYMNPRLTTIRQHRESIAQKSVELIIRQIEEGDSADHVIEPFHLIQGESVSRKLA